MHDFDRVVSVLLILELHKSVALMFVGDLVPRNVDIHDGSALGEQLPEETFVHFRVDVACVDCGLLISLVEGGNHCHALIIRFYKEEVQA